MVSTSSTSPVAPVAPVFPVTTPNASAPVLVVKETVGVPPAATADTLTELTLPVVLSKVFPSELKPKSFPARSEALSVISGVVIELVLETFNVRSSSSCISCVITVTLSSAASWLSAGNGSFVT